METRFFDLKERFKKLDKKDPLINLNILIDWDTLNKIRKKDRESITGRKSFDVVEMFKVLVLQYL